MSDDVTDLQEGSSQTPQESGVNAARSVGFFRRMIEGRLLITLGPVIVLVALTIVFTAVQPRMLSAANLQAMAIQASGLLIMASGLTFVILMGSIDLSFASLAALASVVFALMVQHLGWAALLLVLVLGAAVGAFQGITLVRVKMPSLVITLATMSMWMGIANILSSGNPIALGSDSRYTDWMVATVGGVPVSIIIAGVVFVALLLVERRTWFGRLVTAIGAGELVVQFAGVKTGRVKVAAFALAGLMAALGGLVLTARLASGSPTIGGSYLLFGLAAVLVGGTAISGGVGGLWRTLVGTLLVTVLNSGMNMLEIHAYVQQALVGALLLVAVVMSFDRSRVPVIK